MFRYAQILLPMLFIAPINSYAKHYDPDLIGTIKIDNAAGCTLKLSEAGKNLKYELIKFPFRPHLLSEFKEHSSNIESLMKLNKDNSPALYFIRDEAAPNAMALNYGVKKGTNYTILFGERMYFNSLLKERSNNDPTGKTYTLYTSNVFVSSVLAHEYAHVAQYIDNVRGPTKNIELMADILSGWYVAMAATDFGNGKSLNNNQIKNINFAMNKTFLLGDYLYNHPNHHGTPKERLNAFIYGFNLAKNNYLYKYWDAFHEAANHLKLRLSH